jgi:ABC-type nitrate/sulfonate/bicarbonate transport system substrate-binding protein
MVADSSFRSGAARNARNTVTDFAADDTRNFALRRRQRRARDRRDDTANDASARWAKAFALDAPYSPAAAADQVKIGIARTISDAGYYIADAIGFFREEGLDVSITGFNSAAQMIAPLGTGELDVGGGTVSAGFYNAVGRGILMKIVADQASTGRCERPRLLQRAFHSRRDL